MKKFGHGINQRVVNQFAALIFVGVGLLIHGCASTPTENQADSSAQIDPYEDFNRTIYDFNSQVDKYVAAPVSDGYKYITPGIVQTGITNFFDNLKGINTVINDLLQAKFEQGAQDTGRFLLNSTLGVGGLLDVAKDAGLEQNEEDFEQTLAVWGVPEGAYLVLPLMGPSTTRGIPGAVFDAAANPATYVGYPVQLLSVINSRANADGAIKFVDEASLDSYVFTRESFLQWRKFMATDGASGVADDDLLGEDDDFLDEGLSGDEAKLNGEKEKPSSVEPKPKELTPVISGSSDSVLSQGNTAETK
ncbi:VacJ family lipoprotein [Methylicorpusculum oleiharenae]|uniref:MlaA family lipoprotein n=1 Tax=Methylicorpusculum oleiharenae TaxID=1338687 RepID=UPI00135A35FB|nr:VacJ family lipoprotein [Methylicorpusculum oleiharenae]MCD2451322.1 VacJ family lipoprotein [Methylicorpusculum oleiharenae]